MTKVRLAIFYYSSTGANYQISKWAEEAAKSAGAEVKRLRIKETAPQEAIQANKAWKKFADTHIDEPEATLDDLEWAQAYIFSVPTRYGNLPSQVQQFFDTTGGLWMKGKLVDKVVSGMTSAQNPHGGQESTLQSLYKTMTHWGAIIVPPAYSFKESFAAGGNPYGTSTAVDGEGNIQDDIRTAVEEQVKRTIKVAGWLIRGKERGEE